MLITHVDSAVGRRLVKLLYHDSEVSLVLATGTGPEPSFLEPYREKIAYQRIDWTRARQSISFFASERFARARLDSIVHLPYVDDVRGARVPGGVAALVTETRRLLEEALLREAIARFVYLSSAFVYRPEPSGGSVVAEDRALGVGDVSDAEIPAWIDADLTCQGALHAPKLAMTILRAATIVTETGEFVSSPPLTRGSGSAGFDPLLSLVADRDVARALVLALHADRPGVYNVSGRETFPRSALRDDVVWFGPLPLPGALADAASLVRQALGRRARGETLFHRFGLVLNARLAADALGFEPQYRIEVRGAGADRRIDTVRCR